MTISHPNHAPRAGLARRSEHFSHVRPAPLRDRVTGKKPFQIMKFGGTSVGDAACIERVIEIVRSGSEDADIIVVVSAMSGVTNQLVAAASLSEAGQEKAVADIFAELRRRHVLAASELLHSATQRNPVEQKMEALLQLGEQLCQGTMLLRELTSRTRDAISSLGERLSVQLIAAAFNARGLSSEAIEATELIATNASYGAADPCMDLTRQRCESRLLPLLRQRVMPVITGFIGSAADGTLTTLGRGGSDYSATILGAALEAEEVIIWTDVDGMQTSDPKVVAAARVIPEISYREAAELAHFGAKVLHPKTLRPVMQRGIPLWIRSTFAPEQPGTRITPAGAQSGAGVKALTALNDAALITISGSGFSGLQDILGRTLHATAAAQVEVLFLSQASAQNALCLAVPAATANYAVEALREEFIREPASDALENIVTHSSAAIVTVVGENLKSVPGVIASVFRALDRIAVNVLAIAQGSSDCAMSFVVEKKDADAAVAGIHREFRLEEPYSQVIPRAVDVEPLSPRVTQ
ncbi:MAG TPA: aspartate kinase [Candidatus Aquilonibacter sp.]|jgi:aspartokinase/homoserine dehydrogenase 1|nr:aspartate kinase [Candidatus Aquilonibacter sp.]